MNNLFKEIWQNQSEFNQVTLRNIERIQNFLVTKPNYQQLLDFLNHWQHPQQLYIEDRLFFIFFISTILCIALGIYVHYIFYITAVIVAIFGFIKKIPSHQISDTIQDCEAYVLEQKYQLFHDDHTKNFNDFNMKHYPLFELGNYENNVQDCMYGSWKFEEKEYPYMLFNYHYVDKSTTSDDDGGEETSYKHYDLWGIMIAQFPVQGISIASKQKKACRLGIKWSTSDIQFNRQYQTSGIDEMELAKFFTPKYLLTLDEILGKFKGDIYIHPKLNTFCWLFDHNIFLNQTAKNNIKDIKQLALHLTDYRFQYYEELKENIYLLLKEIHPDYVLEKNESDL